MVLFPVILVWMALGILNISSRITRTADPLLLTPNKILKNAKAPDGTKLMIPAAATSECVPTPSPTTACAHLEHNRGTTTANPSAPP